MTKHTSQPDISAVFQKAASVYSLLEQNGQSLETLQVSDNATASPASVAALRAAIETGDDTAKLRAAESLLYAQLGLKGVQSIKSEFEFVHREAFCPSDLLRAAQNADGSTREKVATALRDHMTPENVKACADLVYKTSM